MFEELFEDNLAQDPQRAAPDVLGIPACGGVFALTGANGTVIQLAATQNLRRALAARLQRVAGAEARTDLAGVTTAVCWVRAFSRFECTLRYHAIARVLYPRNHLQMCAFGPAWFAVIDLTERLARWRVADDPALGRTACVGPFSRRSFCETLVKQLEDLYSLCREHHILDQTPHGQACSYFEMGRCPAPCDGSISLEDYRAELCRSVEDVLAGGGGHAAHVRREMEAAAGRLEFEHAGRLKDALGVAEEVRRTLALRPRRREDFRYLVVQRAGGRTRVKPFFVRAGEVETGTAVSLRGLESAVEAWLERAGTLRDLPDATTDVVLARERMWIVSHFLGRSDPGGGLFLHADALPSAAELALRVRECFGPLRKPARRGPHRPK